MIGAASERHGLGLGGAQPLQAIGLRASPAISFGHANLATMVAGERNRNRGEMPMSCNPNGLAAEAPGRPGRRF